MWGSASDKKLLNRMCVTSLGVKTADQDNHQDIIRIIEGFRIFYLGEDIWGRIYGLHLFSKKHKIHAVKIKA